MRRAPIIAAAVVAALLSAAPASAASASKDTVTISGRAYAFNHMDTFIAGATIRVREFPKLSATTDATGDYALEVPDERNVTPYIEPPEGYNQIDLQTLHPRGKDIENANFQTPADFEYNALAGILSVPIGADGRPEECVIVTTASARNVRGVSYETFEERTPHGVPGATAVGFPELPPATYFNEFVIPDASKTETSEDGGIIWTGVPAGTYRIVTTSPTARFASFLATCEPGRVVNANPPWGAYELTGEEKPLGASVVASSLRGAQGHAGEGVFAKFESGEAVSMSAVVRLDGERIGRVRDVDLPARTAKKKIRVDRASGSGRAKLTVKLRDAAGDVVKQTRSVRLSPR